ncbi:hypothetical protein SHIRM173S_02828 [Streptomyces hirsutus]
MSRDTEQVLTQAHEPWQPASISRKTAYPELTGEVAMGGALLDTTSTARPARLPSPPGSQGSPSLSRPVPSETGPNSPGRCTTPIPTAPRRTVSRDPGCPHPRFGNGAAT